MKCLSGNFLNGFIKQPAFLTVCRWSLGNTLQGLSLLCFSVFSLNDISYDQGNAAGCLRCQEQNHYRKQISRC